MSHIREEKETIKLGKYVNQLKNNDNLDFTIEEILMNTIPKDDNGKTMIGSFVSYKSWLPAAYSAKFNKITIGINGLMTTAEEMANVIKESIGKKEIENLTTYCKLFAILHEIEHGYQFLIVKERLPFSNKEVKQGYQNIVKSITTRESIIPNPIIKIANLIRYIKHYSNAYNYILERNASFEAANDICLIAKSRNEQEVFEAFGNLRNSMEYIGYEKDSLGCMYKTHKDLGLIRKYNKIERTEQRENERTRYGLEVDENTRDKLIKRIKNNRIEL